MDDAGRVARSLDDAAALLEGHPDYRVLRRVAPMRRAEVEGVRAGFLAGVALDVETTGLDPAVDTVVELALQRFWADADGRIVMTGRPHAWLQDPGRPLAPEVAALTGLSDGVLRGRSIIDAEAANMIRDADFVVAHNAAFDRPFVEARLPDCAGRPWICSLRDLDWRAAGFEGGRLGDLLWQAGYFFRAHRAGDDVAALLRLLDHRLPGGCTVLRDLVDAASRPTFRVTALDAPFAARSVLKAGGYRWDVGGRVWHREVAEHRRADEEEWLERSVYRGRGRPMVERVTWRTRHGSRPAG